MMRKSHRSWFRTVASAGAPVAAALFLQAGGVACSSDDKTSEIASGETSGDAEGEEIFAFKKATEDRIDNSVYEEDDTDPAFRVATIYLKGGAPSDCATWELEVTSADPAAFKKPKGDKLKKSIHLKGVKFTDGKVKVKTKTRGAKDGLRFLVKDGVAFKIEGEQGRCSGKKSSENDVSVEQVAQKFSKKVVFKDGKGVNKVSLSLRIAQTKQDYLAKKNLAETSGGASADDAGDDEELGSED
jgi:hypothetical protein